MINDPELKAMSEVYDALQNLDGTTQKRVVEWVLSKLETSSSSGTTTSGAKRGPKPGSKRIGKKRGRPRSGSSDTSTVGAKRGPKSGKKRGPKPATKRKGKLGRPPGSPNSSEKSVAISEVRRRGRPRK